MKKSIISLLILQLLSIIVWSQETSFTVQPSKITIGINDYFQLTYTISNGNDIKDFVPPKFENFKVMGNPLQSNDRNIAIINGKSTEENTISITFTLSPSKLGNFQINPAKVELDGKAYNTSTVSVTVVKESQAKQSLNLQVH